MTMRSLAIAKHNNISFQHLRPPHYLHRYSSQLDGALNRMERTCLQGDGAVQVYMPRKHSWSARFGTMDANHQFTMALDSENPGDVAGVSAFAVQHVSVSRTNKAGKERIEFPFIGDLRVNQNYRGLGMASEITRQQLRSIKQGDVVQAPFWMCSVKVDNPASLKLYCKTFGAKTLCKWYAHWASTQPAGGARLASQDALESESESCWRYVVDGRTVVIEAHTNGESKRDILTQFFNNHQLFPLGANMNHLTDGNKVVTYTARYATDDSDCSDDSDDDNNNNNSNIYNSDDEHEIGDRMATLSTYKSPVCQMGFMKAPVGQKWDLLKNCLQQQQYGKIPSVLRWLAIDVLPKSVSKRIEFKGVIEDTVYMFGHASVHSTHAPTESDQYKGSARFECVLYETLYEHAVSRIKDEHGLTSFACINNPHQEKEFGNYQQKGMSIVEVLLCADNNTRFVDDMIAKENDKVFLNPKLF